MPLPSPYGDTMPMVDSAIQLRAKSSSVPQFG